MDVFSEDSEIFSDVQSAVNPLNDNFESVMGTLGLSERKPVPDPVVFDDTDPLGISLMAAPHSGLTASLGKSLQFSSDAQFSSTCLTDKNLLYQVICSTQKSILSLFLEDL